MTKNKLKPKNIPIDSSTTHQTTNPNGNFYSKGMIIKLLSKIFGGRYLESNFIENHILYFVFLIVLGLIYITNTNIADKKIREINKLNKELKELRSEYIITKSELMFLSKQSEVAKRVEPIGLKETTQQPYLIISEDTTLKLY